MSVEMWKRLITADDLEGPRGWIQWKGTMVCMDVHCSCGEHGHVDADFAYFYRCRCGKLWSIGQNVRLHELTEAETKAVTESGRTITESEHG